MPLFCPRTGFKVFTDPQWVDQQVSNFFTANFWIINDSIIYSLPKGYADLKGVRNSLSLNEKVAGSVSEGCGPFVQIEDYAFLAGSSSDSRRYFTDNINRDKRRLSLIFCNLSQPFSIAVKIGKRFNTTGKTIHVARHYSDAVKRALELSDQNQRKSDIAPIELNKCFDTADRFLSPVELLSEEAWNIHTPEFSNRMVLVDRCILHSTSEGYFESKHIPLIEHTRSQCQSVTSEDSRINYIVVDTSRLQASSRSARALYMKSLKRWHQRFPLRMYVVYGANTFIKTALHLARPLMPFKVKIAKDREHAFHLIRDDRHRNSSKKIEIPKRPRPTAVTNDDIDNIMAFIGSINWAQEGIDDNFQVGEDHPLYFLYQSIKLIKEELDDLFKEREQLEGQLHQSRKMESIGTLAGGIAHDFNTILGIIIANIDIALEDIPDSNPVQANLDKIKAAGLRATGIVKQLLNFSRKTDRELKPIGAIAVIKDALNFLRSTIPTSIEIRKKLPLADVKILADPIQINQVMMNICTNASQAMEGAGGVLEINVEKEILTEDAAQKYPELTAGQHLKIRVSDTGQGIDAGIIDRIFDPYFTTKESGKGSGMGLAVVHAIVTNHGGAIAVDSKPGVGATFTILFPVVAEKSAMEIKATDQIRR